MTASHAVDGEAAVLMQLHQLYARQSQLIDGGADREWAQTFTPDGEFCSPTYPAPVTGLDDLAAFARRFAATASAAEEVHRHVVTNLYVERESDDALTARAYLQIIATARGGATRLVRFTTITDRVVDHAGEWRIARRTVHRDDA